MRCISCLALMLGVLLLVGCPGGGGGGGGGEQTKTFDVGSSGGSDGGLDLLALGGPVGGGGDNPYSGGGSTGGPTVPPTGMNDVTSLPEPATGIMFLVGFGALAAGLRLRSRARR